MLPMNETTPAKPSVRELYFNQIGWSKWEVRVSYSYAAPFANSRPGVFKGQKFFKNKAEINAALAGTAWESVCDEGNLLCCLRKNSPEMAHWKA